MKLGVFEFVIKKQSGLAQGKSFWVGFLLWVFLWQVCMFSCVWDFSLVSISSCGYCRERKIKAILVAVMNKSDITSVEVNVRMFACCTCKCPLEEPPGGVPVPRLRKVSHCWAGFLHSCFLFTLVVHLFLFPLLISNNNFTGGPAPYQL